MSDAKEMLGWFAKRKGERVNSNNRNHSLIVLDAVNELANAITAMGAGDKDAAKKAIDRIILCEREADRVEDVIAKEISSGAFSVSEREDLLHFIKKADKIADWCLEGGTYIQVMIETEIDLPPHIWESFALMMKELQLEVKMLVNTIDALETEKSAEEITRCVESIRDQERIIDQMEYTSFKKLLLADMDYRAFLLAKGLKDDIEEASDDCKSCGETLLMIVAIRGLY